MASRTALFVTCLVDQLYPEVGEAAVRLLELCDRAPEFPLEQTCCGQPIFNMGYSEEARTIALRTVACFEPFDEVVTPSGSCAAMLRVHYPRLFDGLPDEQRRARHLAAKTFELTELLANENFDPSDSTFEGRVAYHSSCHLTRELGVRSAPFELLRRIPGVELVELRDADVCCGFGGAFAVKMENISAAMLDAKLSAVSRSGAQILTAADCSCLAHLGGAMSRRGLSIQTLHIAQILAARAHHR